MHKTIKVVTVYGWTLLNCFSRSQRSGDSQYACELTLTIKEVTGKNLHNPDLLEAKKPEVHFWQKANKKCEQKS